jgi:hypothetical protein
MLSLSCLPCNDSEECNVKEDVKIAAAPNHGQHGHDAEACTPFCTCSCCAVSVFNAPLYKMQSNKPIVPAQKYPMLNVSFNTNVYYPIWQPPKIS